MHFLQIDSESYSEYDLSNDARYNKGSTSLISPAIETDKGFDHDYNLQNTYSNKESIAALALLNLMTHEKGNVKSGDLNPNSGEFHINSNQSEEKIKEYSSNPDDIATCCNTRRMKAVPFPVKLMNILLFYEDDDIIEWVLEGSCFVIKKPKAFVSYVLPIIFKGIKFSSFTRKLYRWGFLKLTHGPYMGAYYHKNFQRNNFALCLKMRGNKHIQSQADYEESSNPDIFFPITVQKSKIEIFQDKHNLRQEGWNYKTSHDYLIANQTQEDQD